MKQEIVKRFLNKNIRLGLHDQTQILYGKITEVQEDCMVFETDKAVSVISLDSIKSIVLPGGW